MGNEAIGFVNDTIHKKQPISGWFGRKCLYVNSDFLNDPQAITFNNVWIRGIMEMSAIQYR
jgi:hypothetical protein